ncbi:HAD family hydrolase [Terrisporobacter sp.]|uniref:HAD family hydrolase n=1 Tax=Terrisporobacter sp. TaxID=1965305 RepID=UPI00262071F8|nr:HAD family hydrolase [Terrisporobacter sp.]
MKKIIFFDIDGTLIDCMNNLKDITQKVKDAIRNVQKNGDYAFIATGRPYAFLPKPLIDFGFDGFILVNGAHIIINNKTIYSDPIDKEFIKGLVDELENNKVEYVLQGEQNCYMRNEFCNFHNYLDKIGIEKTYVKDNYNTDEILVHKIEMLCPDDETEDLCLSLIKNNPQCDYFSSINKRAIEVYLKKNTKANAILQVIDYLNISIENTFAFGDGKNDIEMLREVKYGIAMGNASDEVKKHAKYVTDSVKNDGVAIGIEKYVMN